jgi:hypothetical protein
MISKLIGTKHSLLAIEVYSAKVETCNLILCLLPLGRSNFRVPRDQPQPGSFLNKREEPGNEVAH